MAIAEIAKIIALILGLSVVFFYIIYKKSAKIKRNELPHEHQILETLHNKVFFYKALNSQDQKKFFDRVSIFLNKVNIVPIYNARVNYSDKVLVAAAAIMPLFRFDDWFYNGLHEVLIYPNAFNEAFMQEGPDRHVAGMVGSGVMQGKMILSLPDLRHGFLYLDQNNTALHEFVHLLDISDGSTDGIPNAIMESKLVTPWIKLMHQYIQKIRTEDSDIDYYGARNETEFFAVVSEYFFENPEKLKNNHPQLYALLDRVFHPQ